MSALVPHTTVFPRTAVVLFVDMFSGAVFIPSFMERAYNNWKS